MYIPPLVLYYHSTPGMDQISEPISAKIFQNPFHEDCCKCKMCVHVSGKEWIISILHKDHLNYGTIKHGYV